MRNEGRRSIRLKDYDYSSKGMYFVTICAWNRECFFGNIKNGACWPTNYGNVVIDYWSLLPSYFINISLDSFILMPNHIHGIISISKNNLLNNGQVRAPAPTKKHHLPEIIRTFKSLTGKKINKMRDNKGCPVWQRNYYERIIRDETELRRIRIYIENNPHKWIEDTENPINRK